MIQCMKCYLGGRKPFSYNMSHYELAVDVTAGLESISHPRADAINEEFILMQQAKMRYLIDNVDKDSKSVGLAQQFNAISSKLEPNESKEAQA